MRHRGTWLTAVLGLVAVVGGLLVLRSPAAQASFGWFAYEPLSPEVLDGLVAWNAVRTVGALLVLLGLSALALVLGTVAARRGLTPPRLGGRVIVLAGLLCLGGAAAFVALGLADRGGIETGAGVWTRDRLSAALVVATGLVVGAVGLGLRRRDAG